MLQLSSQIKQKALDLGFDACGICKAEVAGEHAAYLQEWLNNRRHAGMQYMENFFDKRTNPALLQEEAPARSVIVTALNYFPPVRRDPSFPSFAYYAYGQDYHKIIRDKLNRLLDFIASEYALNATDRDISAVRGRVFCDTAPILEKYHAQQAGLGWIGKHTLLVIPGKGTYFFIGIILVNIELEYDSPAPNRCGSCRRCLDACPTKALERPFVLNAGKCISYLTIEKKEEKNKEENLRQNHFDLKANVYGCDTCAKACPWNRFATPCPTPEFAPSEAFLQLDMEALETLDKDKFDEIFRHSPVKRAGFAGIKRNITHLRNK